MHPRGPPQPELDGNRRPRVQARWGFSHVGPGPAGPAISSDGDGAGVDARLVVFDALPHTFWYDPTLPEAIEANHMMADFFAQQLTQ
jgi:hypothetical protein